MGNSDGLSCRPPFAEFFFLCGTLALGLRPRRQRCWNRSAYKHQARVFYNCPRVLFAERPVPETFFLLFFSVLTITGFDVAAQVPAALGGPLAEHSVPMKTRDGVTLRADVYRPVGEGPFPVLLQRTPYDKGNAFPFAQKAVARGFMVVVQDVRGRYASEGEWYTFKHESDDGYDAVEWAAALPKSNGKVGMWGGSYVGATQMLAAIAHPPHLAGICPVVTASNYHENWAYQGGAFEQWFNEDWTTGLAQNTYERLVSAQADPVGGSWALPLTSYSVLNLEKRPDLPSASSVAPYFL